MSALKKGDRVHITREAQIADLENVLDAASKLAIATIAELRAQLTAAEAARERLQAEQYARNRELRAAWADRDALAKRLKEVRAMCDRWNRADESMPDRRAMFDICRIVRVEEHSG